MKKKLNSETIAKIDDLLKSGKTLGETAKIVGYYSHASLSVALMNEGLRAVKCGRLERVLNEWDDVVLI